MTPFEPTQRDADIVHKAAFRMKSRGLPPSFIKQCVRYGLYYAEIFDLVALWSMASSGWEQDDFVLKLMKELRNIR